MNIFKYRWKIGVFFLLLSMSVSLGYLLHAKNKTENVHELLHAHRLSIAIRAHKAILFT